MVVCSLAVLVLVAEPSRASLYSPEEPFALDVDEGMPEALPFGEFKRRLAVLKSAINDTKIDGKYNPDRQKFLDRIARTEPKLKDDGKGLTDPEKEKAKERIMKKWPDIQAAAFAADLLRTGQLNKALDLLGTRTRSENYFVLSTLAHIHATSGGWSDALRYLDACPEMPTGVKGLTKSQRDWWAKLDRGYFFHLCRLRQPETEGRVKLSAAERKKADEEEDVLPLFPVPGEDGKPVQPVRFVNDSGVYEPGTLASAESAKLPPDAIAVVQQLLLWFPNEVRLYWLLAELYAAGNDLASAETIFDECVGPLAQGNRKLLTEHRNAVRAAIEARKPPPPPPPQKAPIDMTTILIYFGVVALIAVFAFARMIMRRARGASCGPVG
jgi:hypothetical protein